MKLIAIYVNFFVLILLLSNCKKENLQKPDVYVAGTYTPPGKKLSAAYWLNGEFYPLENGNVSSYASDILVDNGSVYVSGDYDGRPCIWINGTRFFITTDFSPGTMNALMLKDGKIFAVGNLFFNNYMHAVMFMGNQAVFAEASSSNSYANDALFSVDGDTYVSGIFNGQAALWKNGSKTELGKSTEVSGLKYFNGKVYVLGNLDKSNTNKFDFGYWEDLSFKSLVLSGQGWLNGLSISHSGQIYVVGNKKDNNGINQATLWVNDQPTVLSIENSNAVDIDFFKSDVYVAGMNSQKACYWLNGNLVNLNTTNSGATAIFIDSNN